MRNVYWANPKAQAHGWIRLIIVVRFSRFALLFRAKHLLVAAMRSVEMGDPINITKPPMKELTPLFPAASARPF
jgi:hypothetical protein